MKKILLPVFCYFIFATAIAQNAPATLTIKGTAIDSVTNKPIGYLTVALLDVKTQLSVKGTLTKDNGSFELKSVSGKPYQLVFVFVGYTTKTINIKETDVDLNLGQIVLQPSKNLLKEVSITAVRPLMKQEVDRISYDVKADPESVALSALDMMRKVPLLSVDGNDNIQLKGSGNYKILVNGKESALVAKNPSEILKSMPASNIEKIEVITTPPAKYDAEGLAGIINIITKKNADQGYNIGINVRENSVFGPGFNLNSTLKQGKFGISIFGGFGSNGTQTTAAGSNERIFLNNNNIVQSGYNTQTGNYKYGGTEMSFEIDSLNLITSSIDIDAFDQSSFGPQFSSTDSLGIDRQRYTLNNTNTNNNFGFDGTLNYQLGFKKSKDRLLTFSYKYSYSPNKQFNGNLLTNRFNYPFANYPDYQQYNDAGNKDHTFQVDYASSINKKVSIEAGGKAILRNNYSNFHVDDRDTLTKQYNTNAAQTNDFTYHQDIYSLYNSYQLKLEKWTGKAGLRFEYTSLNANFISSGVITAPSYYNLIPSISLQRSFKTSSINFGFTQRIQRPGIEQLNPFVDRSNPSFINAGNPALKPELDNTFELTYSNFAKNSLNIGVSYAFSNNSIQNVSSLQAEQVGSKLDTVTYTTFQNLGTNKTLGLNINTNMNFGKQFTISINGRISNIWLSGTFNGSLYHNSGLTGNVFSNLRYKFNNGFALGINAGYFTGNVSLQGKSNDNLFNQYLFSKELFDKKMSIALVANNPYHKYHNYTSTINSTAFYQSTYNQNYYRTFAIRLNYRFGRLNSDIKKNEHGINNDDTKGGKSTSTGG